MDILIKIFGCLILKIIKKINGIGNIRYLWAALIKDSAKRYIIIVKIIVLHILSFNFFNLLNLKKLKINIKKNINKNIINIFYILSEKKDWIGPRSSSEDIKKNLSK